MTTFVRTRGDDCLSDLTLDWLTAAELDDAATARAEAHLRGCATCQGRKEAIEAQRAEYRATRRVLPSPRRQPRRWSLFSVLGGGGLVAAAAAAMVFFFVLRPESATRTKGGDRLGFYVKRGDAVWKGRALQVLNPGDALRFDVAGADGRFIAVFSLDGGGQASIYFPTDRPSAVRSSPGPLPASTVLDAQLGTEQLIGLFCDREQTLEPLRLVLEQTGKLVPPEGCDVDVVTIEKRAP